MAVVPPGGNSPGSYTIFEGTGQNDTVSLAAGSALIAAGGAGLNEAIATHAGDDVVLATEQNDSIFVGGGNDTAFGSTGNDAIEGGDGNDNLNGGAGNDVIVGSGGNDTLTGGGGNDTFVFTDGFGNDTITDFNAGDRVFVDHAVNVNAGANGAVLITDNAGNSVTLSGPNALAGITAVGGFTQFGPGGAATVTVALTGAADPGFGNTIVGTGNGETININANGIGSTVLAQEGNDVVFGSTSSDVLQGQDGGDALYGFAGNDTLLGGNGPDLLDGGAGNDIIDGGPGNDTLAGGAGNDTFFFQDGFGNDTITDFGAGDQVFVDHAVNVVATGGGAVLITDNLGNSVTLSGPNAVAGITGAGGFNTYTTPGFDPIL